MASRPPTAAAGKPEIRDGFFAAYPPAAGSVLDHVPSNQNHCGVCHFRFNGGGPRNPFGVAVQGPNDIIGDVYEACGGTWMRRRRLGHPLADGHVIL